MHWIRPIEAFAVPETSSSTSTRLGVHAMIRALGGNQQAIDIFVLVTAVKTEENAPQGRPLKPPEAPYLPR